jgi:hypothetical protein
MKEVGLYRDFSTKREFLKWIEDHVDDIDFDEEVRIEYYPKKEEEND